MINLNQFLTGYIECALWSTTDSRDEDANETYSLDAEFDDVSDQCRAAMLRDCQDFIDANKTNLHWFKAKSPNCDDWRLGFLFWLNRSGHGSGYWDDSRMLCAGTPGDLLSDAAKVYGSFELYGDFDMGVVRSHHYG